VRAHERPRVVVPPDSSPPPAALARGHAPPPLQPLLLLPCHLSHSLPWGHLGARGCHGSGQTRLRRRGGGDLSEIKGCPPPRPRRALARARPAFLPSLLAGRPGLPAARAGQGATVACGNSARLICTAHARPAARAGLSSCSTSPPGQAPAPSLLLSCIACCRSPVCPMGFFEYCALLLLLPPCTCHAVLIRHRIILTDPFLLRLIKPGSAAICVQQGRFD
jgi:hypothetical protein